MTVMSAFGDERIVLQNHRVSHDFVPWLNLLVALLQQYVLLRRIGMAAIQ
jgi:hypothetical protein